MHVDIKHRRISIPCLPYVKHSYLRHKIFQNTEASSATLGRYEACKKQMLALYAVIFQEILAIWKDDWFKIEDLIEVSRENIIEERLVPLHSKRALSQARTDPTYDRGTAFTEQW